MRPFAERLSSGEALVGDGAMGTMLLGRTLEAGQPPELATLEHPEVLEEVSRLYLEAGADIVETNTFGASPCKLALSGLEGEVGPLNRRAVQIARGVAGERAYVAASVGPSGRLLEPYGETSASSVYESFRTQLEHLLAAAPDCVFVETMVDLQEASLAIRAAKDLAPTTPVMAMMTFDRTPRGFFTVMGVSVEGAARGLQEAGADGIGSNCGNGIENMVAIARELKQYSELPLIFQANAGLPRLEGERLVYGETPGFTAQKAREMVAAGVSVIGGCCGTTPEHVRAIRAMVDHLRG